MSKIIKANPKKLNLLNYQADNQNIKDNNSEIVDKMVECFKCNDKIKNVDMV